MWVVLNVACASQVVSSIHPQELRVEEVEEKNTDLFLEWHIPYSCAHHGFVCEFLGFLPALQKRLGQHAIAVTGLGSCSEEMLSQLIPEERNALEIALEVAERRAQVRSQRCVVLNSVRCFGIEQV